MGSASLQPYERKLLRFPKASKEDAYTIVWRSNSRFHGSVPLWETASTDTTRLLDSKQNRSERGRDEIIHPDTVPIPKIHPASSSSPPIQRYFPQYTETTTQVIQQRTMNHWQNQIHWRLSLLWQTRTPRTGRSFEEARPCATRNASDVSKQNGQSYLYTGMPKLWLYRTHSSWLPRQPKRSISIPKSPLPGTGHSKLQAIQTGFQENLWNSPHQWSLRTAQSHDVILKWRWAFF